MIRGCAAAASFLLAGAAPAAAGGVYHACTFDILPQVVMHYPPDGGPKSMSVDSRPAVPMEMGQGFGRVGTAVVDGYEFHFQPADSRMTVYRGADIVAEDQGRCLTIGGPVRDAPVTLAPPPAATPAVAEAGSAAGAQTGAWEVHIDRSSFDDTTTVVLTLASVTELTGRLAMNRGPAHLLLRCRENTTSAYVILNEMFLSDTRGHGKVDYRIDQARAKSVSMDVSNDNKALGLWSGARAIPFIRELTGGDRLLLRATPFNESAVEVEFRLTGLSEAVAPLREACGW